MIITLISTFSFYVFGVIDTLITSFLIVIYSLLTPNQNGTNTLNQKKFIYKYLTQFWGRRLFMYTGSKIELIGRENLDPDKNYLIMVNHQSNFDIYILIGFMKTPLCLLSKVQNFKIPIIGTVMDRMGCIPIDRSNAKKSLDSVQLTAERYEEGMSIIIFPEGTRSRDGELLPLKTGFLHIIDKVTSPCHLLPVSLSGVRKIQYKQKWLIKPSPVRLQISPSITINPGDLKTAKAKEKLIKQLETAITKHYQKDIRPN